MIFPFHVLYVLFSLPLSLFICCSTCPFLSRFPLVLVRSTAFLLFQLSKFMSVTVTFTPLVFNGWFFFISAYRWIPLAIPANISRHLLVILYYILTIILISASLQYKYHWSKSRPCLIYPLCYGKRFPVFILCLRKIRVSVMFYLISVLKSNCIILNFRLQMSTFQPWRRWWSLLSPMPVNLKWTLLPWNVWKSSSN